MNNYSQNYGHKIAEQAKWENEYEDGIKNFDLFSWLLSQGKENDDE